jgi:L-ribulokinase
MYRAMLEATAFGVRWICDTLKDAGVPVRRFVASGGLPAKSPLLMQIYADVLGEPIEQAAGDQPVALGAAMLGVAAAGADVTGHADVASVIRAIAPPAPIRTFSPDAQARRQYDELYRIYRQLAAPEGIVTDAMRRLRRIG